MSLILIALIFPPKKMPDGFIFKVHSLLALWLSKSKHQQVGSCVPLLVDPSKYERALLLLTGCPRSR